MVAIFAITFHFEKLGRIKVCLKFDWSKRQFDFIVDNLEVAKSVPFEDSYAVNLGKVSNFLSKKQQNVDRFQKKKIYLCNNDIRSETHWDNFLALDEQASDLPSVHPSAVVLSGGEWVGQVELSSSCPNIALVATPLHNPTLVRYSNAFDSGFFCPP